MRLATTAEIERHAVSHEKESIMRRLSIPLTPVAVAAAAIVAVGATASGKTQPRPFRRPRLVVWRAGVIGMLVVVVLGWGAAVGRAVDYQDAYGNVCEGRNCFNGNLVANHDRGNVAFGPSMMKALTTGNYNVATGGDGPNRRRLIGRGDQQAILRDHADEMLIGGAEQIARKRRQRLRPRESRPARERDHVTGRIDAVQRPIGAERGLFDVCADGVHAAAAEIEREQIVFAGRDKEVFGFGVEADDPLDGRQFALQHAFDRGEPRQPVQLRRAPLGGQPDCDSGGARENLELANPLRRLLL